MNQPASSPAAQDWDPVKALWSFCNLLREDGVSATEYVEQLTFLLFIRLAHEQRRRPLNPLDVIGFDAWEELRDASGQDQQWRYGQILDSLGHRPGTVGLIFRKAQNRVQDPAKLSRLIDLVDRHHWSGGGSTDRGAVFEALLARMASDRKTGAGQYFTPRPLVEAIVRCVQPTVDDTIMDPACGTGGFLIKSFDYLVEHFPRGVTPEQRARLTEGAFSGNELVDGAARLATMNLVLHGVVRADGTDSRINVGDALARTPTQRASLVLTAPPFGRRSVITVDAADSRSVGGFAHYRPDFWATTGNRQLNFLQHVYTLLETNGRAAVVIPDNVLFEGGAGETIRRRLLASCDLHTLLRLPTGVFYAGGVKANVLFFEKPAPLPDGSPSTKQLWVYDMRSSRHSSARTMPLVDADFAGFVAAYRPGRSRDERVESSTFRSFGVTELLSRDGGNLDLVVSPQDEALPATEPEVDLYRMAEEITEELRSALAEFNAIADELRPFGMRGDHLDRGSAE
ncbi:N-6 DNA methylase [Kitasatospora sp. McL0602]|uniref:class I SAM-dependent DNA methyltransferase n=1 Tax=Kitasatospora sp. McL0602 TaxID=3439530 RepID=UPI003F8BA6E6